MDINDLTIGELKKIITNFSQKHHIYFIAITEPLSVEKLNDIKRMINEPRKIVDENLTI